MIRSIAISIGACLLVQAESWEALGPFGGAAEAIVADPHNPDRMLAAARDAMLFRSDNGGRSWNSLAFPRESTTIVRAMAVAPGDPTAYYVALAGADQHSCGLYRTTTAGDSWEPVAAMCSVEVFSLTVSRADTRLIAAGGRDGVYVTRDGGTSWKRISPAGNRGLQPIMSLALDSADPDIIYAGTPHLPWKTTNGGLTWQSVHTGMLDDSDVFSIEVDPRDPRHVFASACSGIYATRDRGVNWTRLLGIPRSSRRTYTIRQDPTDPTIVYAGTSRGLWKSTNAGLSWKQVSPLIVKSIAFDPRNTQRFHMATADAGIVVTSDGAETTDSANVGFADRPLSAFAVAPAGSLFASVAYELGGGRLFHYLRRESRWEMLGESGDYGRNIISMAVVDSRNIWVATYSAVLRSSDGGRHWTVVSAPWKGARMQSLFVLPGDPLVVLAATAAGVYRSPDLGKSWELVTAKSFKVDALYAASGSGSLTIARSAEGLFLSSDRGVVWNSIESPVAHADLYDLAINDDGSLLAGTSHGLYRSADRGQTWQLAASPLGRGTVRAVTFHPSRPMAFAVQLHGLYQSRDSGLTWFPLPVEGLDRSVVLSLSVSRDDPNLLYVLTKARGVFVLSLADSIDR